MIVEVVRQALCFDKKTFEANHMVREAPLVIPSGCDDWQAFKRWNVDFFMDNAGDVEVPVSRYNEKGNEAPRAKLQMQLRKLMSIYKDYEDRPGNSEYRSYYLAGWHFTKQMPGLLDDMRVPALFGDNYLPYVNDNIIHYDWSSIFIGHKDTETPNHTDSFYVAVWLALIKGRKTIRYVSSRYHEHMSSSVNLFDPDTVVQLNDLDIDVFEARIEAGDIAYHPPGWWHQVKNHSFNIAVSNNFVNRINYLPFKQQLLSKAVLPIFARLSELDSHFELKRKYMDDIHVNTSKSNILTSKYLKNQEMINDFLQEYVDVNRAINQRLA